MAYILQVSPTHYTTLVHASAITHITDPHRSAAPLDLENSNPYNVIVF
jgi:hypothetical protein